MKLTGLHLLLTYQCTFECDHCFVWGSPWASGTMTLAQITEIFDSRPQPWDGAVDLFRGRRALSVLRYAAAGRRLAQQMGFRVGIVSNAYWATSLQDAMECLKPFAGVLADLSVSSDLYPLR